MRIHPGQWPALLGGLVAFACAAPESTVREVASLEEATALAAKASALIVVDFATDN